MFRDYLEVPDNKFHCLTIRRRKPLDLQTCVISKYTISEIIQIEFLTLHSLFVNLSKQNIQNILLTRLFNDHIRSSPSIRFALINCPYNSEKRTKSKQFQNGELKVPSTSIRLTCSIIRDF